MKKTELWRMKNVHSTQLCYTVMSRDQGINELCLVPGEPQDVNANAFNSSTVLVQWRPPADDKQNGVIRAYQIYIQPKNTVSSNHM